MDRSTADGDKVRRQELGEFLRAQRARLPPAAMGLDAGPRRRTPGLRREEVAQLSGLSITWYTWLEQGRDISLSVHALGRLAAVLRLTAAERAYLFDLAGKRDPRAPGGSMPPAPPALIEALPLIACPAYVLDACWNAEGWNEPAAALFTGWLGGGEAHPNLLRFIFLDPAATRFIEDWEVRARRALAEFRADYSRLIRDEAMQALVAELTLGSVLFARAWDEHTVVGREGGLRGFRHPVQGIVSFRQTTLNPAGRPDLKCVILTPAGAGEGALAAGTGGG